MSTLTSTPPFTQSRWTGLLLALGLLVAFVALQLVIAAVVGVALLLLAVIANMPLETAVRFAENGVVAGGVSAVASLLGIGLMWLAVSRAGQRSFRAPMALLSSPGWLLWISPLLAIAIALMFDGVTTLLGKSIVPEILLPYFQGPVAVAVMALVTVVIAPIAEELLFRGVLFNAIERFVPAWFTVLLTALTFGMLHVMTYPGDWYTVLQTAVAGLILGGLRAWTRSLWPSIAFHATNNLYATIQAAVLVNILNG
jgi:membrane protease YdiL (CAAX protease family)